MGAAGLTSSSFEMASKGGVGVELDLDRVPIREAGMTAYEIMLSESQERMLMVVEPSREAEARRVFEKWELDFAVVGRITDTGHMVVRHHGGVVADLPVDPLALASPEYDRPHVATPARRVIDPGDVAAPDDPMAVLKRLMSSPDLASKRWIWEQYDHMVMADTVQRPGGDAAVVRVHGTAKGLAMTCDCTPRYCFADPLQGGRQAVAEAWRNLVAVGAKPLAITDCLNFGNPEKPEIMGQFAGCLSGMGEACRALDFPVISGNVSFYNETNGVAIPPTPSIGGVGLIENVDRMATIALAGEDEVLMLIGEAPEKDGGWLGQSLFLREIAGEEEGAPPPVDLERERRHGDVVRALIERGLVRTCHDISDGGLLVAVAEMAVAGGVGASIETDSPPSADRLHAWLFGEDQGRYVVAVDRARADVIEQELGRVGVPARRIGVTGGKRLIVNRTHAISVEELQSLHEGWFPAYMAGPQGPS
jgi:phosphoribosylformylglycinamidine synthase